MASKVIMLRLGGDEAVALKSEAFRAGLPTSTYAKARLFAAMERDRLALAIEKEAREREADREVSKREMANIVLMKAILLKLGSQAGLDASKIEDAAQASVEKFFTEIYGGQ